MKIRTWRAAGVLAAAALHIAHSATAQPVSPAPGDSLAVELYARPADRAELLRAIAATQPARLAAWRAAGLVTGYRLLFARYADDGVWDALELLTFRNAEARARWTTRERDAPGGLPQAVLAHGSRVVTTPAQPIRHEATAVAGSHPAYLVLPYAVLASTPDYLRYLDTYTLPQFRGWIAEGVLEGYEVEFADYPAGRAWQALILLRYRDDAALAVREPTTTKVRAQLAADPAWKAVSESKQQVRTEKAAAVADAIAEAGG